MYLFWQKKKKNKERKSIVRMYVVLRRCCVMSLIKFYDMKFILVAAAFKTHFKSYTYWLCEFVLNDVAAVSLLN